MSEIIRRVAATEKFLATMDKFYFWTNSDFRLNAFDVVKVKHLEGSFSFGTVENIFHITDAKSFLTNYISNDFGDTEIDELNKYGSKDASKNSPILRQILDVAERGRSLGIILFGAEQFLSNIHPRISGNCATFAFGRTNVIETTTRDFSAFPSTYKNILTRLEQGEYVIQNPIFRSLLKIYFPKPIYQQFKD